MFDQTINQLNGEIDSITITGGEPLLHAQFSTIIDSLGEHKIEYSLASNCVCFEERYTELLNHPPSCVSLSIDGNAEVHDQKRKHFGLYKKTYNTIELLHRVFPKTNISVQMTIDNSNIHCIEGELQKLKSLPNIVQVKLTPNCFSNNKSLLGAIHSISKRYSISKTEVCNQVELQYVTHRILKGQYLPFMMVVKPNGWIHPYCGLTKNWDSINVIDENALSQSYDFYSMLSKRIVTHLNCVCGEYIDLNSCLYDFYRGIWYNQPLTLSDKYVMRDDDRLYMYNITERNVVSTDNAVIAALIECCRKSVIKRSALNEYLCKTFDISSLCAQKSIMLAEELGWVSS